MKRMWNWRCVAVLAIVLAFVVVTGVRAADLVKSEDGKVVGYKDTPKLPWASKWHTHDPDRPWPKDIDPGEAAPPKPAPSDAIVLFDGKDLSKWKSSNWEVRDGYVEATDGDLVTKQAFGDCQLHLQWRAPDPPRGRQMNRGNSGVLMMGKYEIQVFDSYTEKIYPDGIAGAIYGETPPMVHPIRKPGEWNTYDIVFTAPDFEDGKLVEPARVTMFFNGVLVHLNTTIHGPVAWRRIALYEAHPEKLPLHLQAHGNPVRYRNVWIRPLDLGEGN